MNRTMDLTGIMDIRDLKPEVLNDVGNTVEDKKDLTAHERVIFNYEQ